MENSSLIINKEENVYRVEILPKVIKIDLNKIISDLGYKSGNIPEYFFEIIKSVVSEFVERSAIKAGFTIINASSNKEFKKLILPGDVNLDVGKIIYSQFNLASEIAIFLVTIGPGMENWSKDVLEGGDSVKAYIIDLIASNAAEVTANELHKTIGSFAANKNYNITNRYSPGYCNWSVSEQKKIFSFFPDEFCDVKLSDSALMKPIKTVKEIDKIFQLFYFILHWVC